MADDLVGRLRDEHYDTCDSRLIEGYPCSCLAGLAAHEIKKLRGQLKGADKMYDELRERHGQCQDDRRALCDLLTSVPDQHAHDAIWDRWTARLRSLRFGLLYPKNP